MKLITLWEPWASLMALGHKKIETRHWPVHYRGWLAIHAAKRWQANERQYAKELQAKGYLPPEWVPELGKILAVCKLTDCKMVFETQSEVDFQPTYRMLPPSEPELLFGNYELGRYGFWTSDLFRLPSPIPFQSRQGSILSISDDVISEIRRQWRGERKIGGLRMTASERRDHGMTHEEETADFLGDPMNDYCAECLCSWYCTDDDCTCECHDREYEDYGDWEDE